MSYNGSGTFQINSTGQPVVGGTIISSATFNALTADLATGLTTAITKDGQTTTTARIVFAQGINSTLVTDASSVSTGSIFTAGGVGIAKKLYVGTDANIAGLTASSAVATDASKNLVSVTNTGTGSNVLATSPTLVTPDLGTPTTLVLTSATGLPISTGVSGLGTGVATALAVNVGTAGAPVLNGGALGTPSSGTLSGCTVDGTNKVGYLNIPNSGAKTSSYTLVVGDVGKFIELGTGGSVVVPASVFAAGDAISIFNNTSGSISCTCSAVTTVYKGGTDADIASFSVTTRGVATILFITATVAVVTGNLA